MRIHEFAKSLDIPSRSVREAAQALRFTSTSASSSLTPEQEDQLQTYLAEPVMKLGEYAQLHDLPWADVKRMADRLKFDSAHHSSNLTRLEEIRLATLVLPGTGDAVGDAAEPAEPEAVAAVDAPVPDEPVPEDLAADAAYRATPEPKTPERRTFPAVTVPDSSARSPILI